MTIDELNKLVRDAINSVLNISEVIVYYPNAPRPDADYATVNVAELKRIGFKDIEYSTNLEDLDEKVVMQYEAMVSVNFYRANSQQNAGEFAGSMYRNSVIDLFNASGVGFVRPSSIRDLTQLIDQGHEGRHQVDLFLAFELTPVPEIVTGIDTVRVIGDIDNSAQVVEQVDITVSAP